MDFADDGSEVGKQISAKIWLDQRAPPLGAEDHMQQNIAGCMRQAILLPLPGLLPSLSPTHGLRRGLHSCAALRLPHHHTDEGEQAVTSVTSIVGGTVPPLLSARLRWKV